MTTEIIKTQVVVVSDTAINIVTAGVQGPAGSGGSGSGDVVGPASATDNAIARFNGTTGKLLQNSAATIDDSGNISANNLSGTNSGDQTITLTGDVTGSGTGSFAATIANNAVATAKIANDAVTYAKIQNVSATDKLLGRSTAGSGDVEEIACTAAGRALIDDVNSAAQRVTLGLSARAIVFGAVTPGNDTLYLSTYAPFAFTIDSVQNIQTSAGTITAAVKINGTNVTGLSAISVTSSSQDVNASGANSVAIGDEVTLVLSSNSSAANLRGTILITA